MNQSVENAVDRKGIVMNGYQRILYYGKKAFLFLLSLLFLSVFVFYLSRLAPGDPLMSYYGDRVEKMSSLQRERAEEKLGLHDPIYVQYIRWLERAVHGDFGISYKYKTDVTAVIGERVFHTLLLGGTGFVLIFLLAPCLGVLCAFRENGLADRFLCKTGTIMSCIPEFWLALLFILLFSVQLQWLPAGGAYTVGGKQDLSDRLLHLALPLMVVVASHLWYYAYMIRNLVLEEVRADYVLFARSKGLHKTRILFCHCLWNVIPSYLSLMAVSVSHILGGTYMVELVFSYPGLGMLSYESARYKDYNLLMLLSILSAAVVMVCSMAAQVIDERLEPGMRAEQRTEKWKRRAGGGSECV